MDSNEEEFRPTHKKGLFIKFSHLSLKLTNILRNRTDIKIRFQSNVPSHGSEKKEEECVQRSSMINTIFGACNLSVNAIFDFVFYPVPPDIIVDSGRYQLTIRASKCVWTSQRIVPQHIGPHALLHCSLMQKLRRGSGVDERRGGPVGERGVGRIRNGRWLTLSLSLSLSSSHLFSQ